MTPTLGSLFDGSGTCPLAASMCGIEPIWASEIEPFPKAVTSKRFPNMKHLGDITKINGAEIDPVDIITFGSPCQDLSIAGKRAGLEGKRSNLFMEAIRIIREMREKTANGYPRFIIWENVPGAFSSNNGHDFRTVLEEIAETEIPIPDGGKWAAAGMVELPDRQIAWRILDAQYFGVPQRRKRIFLVADFRGKRAGEILFKPAGLHGNLAAGEESRKGTSADAERGIDKAGGTNYLNGWDCQRYRIATPDGTCPTLDAGGGGGSNGVNVFCLQGNGIDRADTAGCNGAGWREGASYTLNTIDRHAVFDTRGNGDGQTVNTLIGDHQNRVTDYTALAVHQNADGEVRASDTAYTVSTNGNASGRNAPILFAQQQFGEYVDKGLASTQQARQYRDATDLVAGHRAVRRLTPTECARLQGFPDWWCADIPHSDTQEYKMWGNGMALPCVLYIMRNIAGELCVK